MVHLNVEPQGLMLNLSTSPAIKALLLRSRVSSTRRTRFLMPTMKDLMLVSVTTTYECARNTNSNALASSALLDSHQYSTSQRLS